MFDAEEREVVFSAVSGIIIEMCDLPVLLRQIVPEVETKGAATSTLAKNSQFDRRRRRFAGFFRHRHPIAPGGSHSNLEIVHRLTL